MTEITESKLAEGRKGTFGCGCRRRNARNCATVRYCYDVKEENTAPETDENPRYPRICECLCHQWGDDEEDI